MPLDELLAEPIVRVLRVLSRFDEPLDQADLREVLDLPGRYYGEDARRVCDAHNTAMRRLVTAGHIARFERRELDFEFGMRTYRSYQITPAGRAELARRLRHAQLDKVATDDELAEVCDGPLDRRRRAA